MDCSQVMAGIEMPGTAADNKGVLMVGATKAGKNPAQAIISDFKKKLESLAVAGQPAVVTNTAFIVPGQDLSMATNAAAQVMPQEVVGILEGFGLLDYQTDISAVSAETVQLQAGEVENPDAAAAQQAQISGQFARMLKNEQPGEAVNNALLQTNAGAEEYSGSLESTNSSDAATAKTVPAESQDAVSQLKSILTFENKPQEMGTAAQQGEPQKMVPAETVKTETANTETANTETAKTETAQQSVPAEAAKAETTQAVMAEAPQEAAGKQVSADKKTEVLPAAADASPVPMANAATETSAAKVQQADMPIEAAEPQKTTADFVKDNVIRIVDKAGASIREGRYEFDLDLKPDFLGKVSIKITMENGEIRMHVKTEDAAAKGLFSDQSASLQSALKEKGIVISNVDVSYQDPLSAGREAFGQQTGGGNGQRREGHVGRGSERYSGSEFFDATSAAAELLGGSQVEYLA